MSQDAQMASLCKFKSSLVLAGSSWLLWRPEFASYPIVLLCQKTLGFHGVRWQPRRMPNLASARAQRFRAYVERLTAALGHLDRHGPLRDYVTGLCLPGDRKSIEPMAARVDPRHVRARHQSMHHFIANAAWDDGAVLRVARETVLAAMDRHRRVPPEMADGARADHATHSRGRPGRARHRGCRLRRRDGVSRCPDGTGHSIHRGDQHRDNCMGARPRALATAGVPRSRSTTDAGSPDTAPSPPQRGHRGSAPAGVGLAHGDVAPRYARRHALALRGGPGATRASRRLAIDRTPRRVAPHRMAADRNRTDQVLALDAAADG